MHTHLYTYIWCIYFYTHECVWVYRFFFDGYKYVQMYVCICGQCLCSGRRKMCVCKNILPSRNMYLSIHICICRHTYLRCGVWSFPCCLPPPLGCVCMLGFVGVCVHMWDRRSVVVCMYDFVGIFRILLGKYRAFSSIHPTRERVSGRQ